jgi:hypothetical protein
MTTDMEQPTPDHLARLAEQYLGLESMEATFALLEVCGASIDGRALPLLHQRLHEEEVQILILQAHGYIRMREKSQQLASSLKPLIAALERAEQDARRSKT